jgi:hypothetical protein
MRFRIHGDRIVGRVADAAAVGGVTFFNRIKGTEELLAERPAHVKFNTPELAPDPRVAGRSSEQLARSDGGTRESSSTKETVPERVTVAQILARNRAMWDQGPVASADANVMEHDLLRAMNKRNRDFWAHP